MCDHTNDKQAALPTLDTVPPVVGRPKKVNLDTGYFSENNIASLEARGIDPASPPVAAHTIRVGVPFSWTIPTRHPMMLPSKSKWLTNCRPPGKATYRLRKSTVEPVIGIVRKPWVCRFSLRGLVAAGGEWTLVCLAYNLKRLHTLQVG
ncbi:MAG: transposase [Chloroflexi bacterium]|nr:transposase [Chloroflexota bacterium]